MLFSNLASVKMQLKGRPGRVQSEGSHVFEELQESGVVDPILEGHVYRVVLPFPSAHILLKAQETKSSAQGF